MITEFAIYPIVLNPAEITFEFANCEPAMVIDQQLVITKDWTNTLLILQVKVTYYLTQGQ